MTTIYNKLKKSFDCHVCGFKFTRWVNSKDICQTACPDCGHLACSDASSYILGTDVCLLGSEES
jgi:hypothetical protein